MKNVLLIIDNIHQYERIKNITLIKNQGAQFHFRHSPVYSPIWEHADFGDKENSIIDVKKDLNYILSHFDLVISVHCYQFFPKELVNNKRCINVHPGYNPINRGWYPQVFSIVHNLPVGATIHEMDEKLDNGPIIARAFVEKYIWDTSLTLYQRVLDKEIELFDAYFDQIIDGTYQKIMPENSGNLFLKADFRNLCKLDLEQTGTFRQFYDLLRALTHGKYKNAYFTDPETGKNIFLKIDIDHE